jgi:hypothetical protein
MLIQNISHTLHTNIHIEPLPNRRRSICEVSIRSLREELKHPLHHRQSNTNIDVTLHVKSKSYSLLRLTQRTWPPQFRRRRRVRRIEELEVQSQALDRPRGDAHEKADFAVAARVGGVVDVRADAGGVLGGDALAGDHL